MKLIYPALALLILLCLGFLLYVQQTEVLLPLRPATHFNAAGQPNGCMSRSGYTLFIAIFGAGLPAFTYRNGLPRPFPAKDGRSTFPPATTGSRRNIAAKCMIT